MKKLNLFFIIVFLLMGSGMLFSQAVDRLYLSMSATGRVYDITGIPATLPAPLTALNYSGGNADRVSNLAVGYDTPAGAPANVVFTHSNTAAGSQIYKNTAVVTGVTSPAGVAIGGIGTNNVPKTDGNPSGVTYGFSTTNKNLYQIYPTSVNLGAVTGDAIWNATTSAIWATDTFFDYQNFVYVILQNVVSGTGTKYLYKINPSTLQATLVTQLNNTAGNPVGVYNADTTASSATSVGNVRGIAYLNGVVYAVSINGNPGTVLNVYSINISTGTSTFLRSYTGITGGLWGTNQDLAAVPYYIPFQFTCGGIAPTSNVPFVRNVVSNGQKFLNIPITNVYADGPYTINVVGADFNSSSVVNITTATTSIQVPLNYTGGGAAGLRTLEVNLSGSTTRCFVNVLVEDDTDGDGIGNSEDLDDDNDGILDTVEDACETEGTPVYINTFGTGARTNDTNVLNHTYTTSTSIADGFYGVTTSAGTTETYNQTDLTGGLDAGNPVITAGSTAGRYLAINIGANLLYQPIYRVSGLSVTPGTRYRFRIDMAGLANGTADIPNLQITIKDTDGNVLAYAGSPGLGMANDDVWRRLSLNFVATTPGVVLEIVNYQASGSSGNDIGIDNIILAPISICDTDGDGIPNSQDFDSDGDGCFDAIEGSENVLSGQLNANGSINTAATGGLGSTRGVNYGVPNLVNSGGAADTGGNVGQGLGTSQDGSKNDCLDTDGDGIPNWQDLDDDNDGILDTSECSLDLSTYVANNFTTVVPAIAGSTSDNTKFLQLRPSDFGLTTAGATNQNATRDYSAFFGLPTGSIIVTVENAHVHPNATSNPASNVFYVSARSGVGATRVRVSGTVGSYVAIEHGQEYYGLHERGITFLDGANLTPSNIYNIGTQVTAGNWQSGNTGNYYFVRHTTATTENATFAYGSINTEVNPKVFSISTNNTVLTNYSTYFIRILPECDNDKDGIPNRLDFDSDGDGCFDAIEGSENVLPGQLNANGSINTTTTGGLGSTVGVNYGVPNLVNAGGAADTGSNVGQGIGVSQDAIKNDCLDTDSDGIPNWQDLDSDNDGILDIFECPDAFVSVDYSSTDGAVTNFSAPAADLGFIFDVYTLDNSFNLNINGTNLSTSKLEFQPDQTDNVRFLDGSRYGNGGIPQIYEMTGTAANPLVRIIIHKNGAVNIYGSKAGGGTLFPLQLYNGNAFNTIIWNQSGPNTVQLSQLVVGPTYITGRGQGVKNGNCDPDSDGISNQFDVDSDGDGCPDAIEGSEAVRYDQVNSMTSTPIANRGQIKVTYNGSTTGTPAQIISASPSSNGVPQLVNYAGVNLNATTNATNLAGIADNTDGTMDVGQGIGTSQNAASRDVECDRCFRPATTPGVGGLATNQGFTALERAGGTATEWPGKIKGAYTALDAKTKGFVINRVPTATLTSIVGVVGMMVYDTTVNCLKIYDGTTWSCFSVQTCNNQ